MWSKMRSLSYKLTIFYVISVLAIVVGSITYVEYSNYQREVSDAMREAEVGPGFINGAIPKNSDFAAVSDNPEFALTGDDIKNRLERFKPFYDNTVAGGVGVHTSIDGPITIDNQDYYNITYKITYHASSYSYEVGPVTVPERHFPATIAAVSDFNIHRISKLYYLPVSGYDDLVWVVSLNGFTYPAGNVKQQIVSDIIMASPLIVIFLGIFGLLISWLTTRPLKKITKATRLLSHSDLSQRVEFKSGDEIGQLAQSFNTMADRLEQSFTSQKRFVSDAAHELRTPLASMKTSVTRALGSERSTGNYQKLLDFLSGRINHMESLVNDLLFLSRVDEGKFKLDETRLDLSSVLDEAEEVFRYLFEDKGIGFSSEIERELYVKSNRKLMFRVISNLLDNAAKNTPSGGQASLKADHQDKDIVITISDTGPGIAPEHLDHIFDRFYKVPGLLRDNDSYGLGLAISKSIVVSIGGSISVQSELGKSCTFTIMLPRYKNDTLNHQV